VNFFREIAHCKLQIANLKSAFCNLQSSLFGALLLLIVCSIAGCDLPGKPKLDDQFVPPQKEMRFNVLFHDNCVACHGVNGKLGPAPPLNDGLFLALMPDKELQRVISEGRAGTLMPAFAGDQGGALTNGQIKVLAQGIRKEWGGTGSAPSGAPPYLASQAKSDSGASGNKEEGLKVFARACASCHGDRGQGGRYGGEADGKPVGAINDPNFLALLSNQALRRLVITGRADIGMPDYAGSMGRPENFQPLTAENVTDVVALLASWRTESVSIRRN
jgi:cytochrome c oxidase cbb3-type subunit 3/ubiquinol-cytochrome c reductase cytochrome c subunit